MVTIESLRGEIHQIFAARAKKFHRASLFAKITLVAIGSSFVAISQLAQVPAGQHLNAWQLCGIISALVVVIGAIFIAVTENDASAELSIASVALNHANEIENSFEGLDEIFENYDRIIELYQSLGAMRVIIEATISSGVIDESAIADKLLASCARSLTIAMGFAQSDQWTICVFKAVPDHDSRSKLRCVAQARAIQCDIANARQWEEGVGVAGVAYSNASEVIIPDTTAEGVRSLFASPKSQSRPYDEERYRSMAAVPIVPDPSERPWGVVVATSDQSGHFVPDGTTGAKTDEGVRALSSMIGLAVVIARAQAKKV